MALTKISLQNAITRETNKLDRQNAAVETTIATIEMFAMQLDLFESPVPTDTKGSVKK